MFKWAVRPPGRGDNKKMLTHLVARDERPGELYVIRLATSQDGPKKPVRTPSRIERLLSIQWTHERVKPSGAMFALAICSSVDGPTADAEKRSNETHTKVESNGIGNGATI